MTTKKTTPENPGKEELLADSVGFLLGKAAQMITDLHVPAFAKFDVEPKQYGILSLLNVRANLSQIEISRELMIDRSTMVFLVDDLERMNLVIRSRDVRDRRAYSLALTRKGKNLLQKLTVELARTEDEFLKDITLKETDTFKKVLRQLVLQRKENMEH